MRKKPDSLTTHTIDQRARSVSDQDAARPITKAVADSEVRYRRLFETAKDGILILDADTGIITEANPYLQAMLG